MNKSIPTRKFGRLTIIGEVKRRSKHGDIFWTCSCRCGTIKKIRKGAVVAGVTKSCGCLNREMSAARGRASAIHGLSNTRIGNTWATMRGRCLNSKIQPYRKYGARGVWICSFLAASPRNIIAVIGNRPPRKTIDRTNTLGGYTCGKCADCLRHKWPLNIRWLSVKEQGRNTIRNRMVTIKGETRCISDWSEKTGIRESTLHYRARIGLDGEDFLNPMKRRTSIPLNVS
jgi:hypothetical protein